MQRPCRRKPPYAACNATPDQYCGKTHPISDVSRDSGGVWQRAGLLKKDPQARGRKSSRAIKNRQIRHENNDIAIIKMAQSINYPAHFIGRVLACIQ